ncbi:MAG TPA: hypothetical protein VIP09_02170 [Dehalococcoidia bacterium]
MSLGALFLVLAGLLFFLLGFHVVTPSKDYNLDEIGWGLIAFGIVLQGVIVPVNFVTRKE